MGKGKGCQISKISGRVRFQIELTTEQEGWMDQLAQKAGCSTSKEAVLTALNWMDWILRQAEAGQTVGSCEDPQNLDRQMSHHAICSILAKFKKNTEEKR